MMPHPRMVSPAVTLLLLCGTVVSAALSDLPDLRCRAAPCNISTPSSCDTVSCKTPAVGPPSTTQGIDGGLSDSTKYALEHGLGQALRKSSGVQWATEQVARRMYRLVEGVARRNQQSISAELLAAFYGPDSYPWGSPHNTGFVGPNATAMADILQRPGNIREVWGMMYVLSKTDWLTGTLVAGLEDKDLDDKTLTSLGLDPTAVRARYELVAATLKLDKAHRYNGVPTFLSPTFDSWVRFDFPGPDETATPTEWNASRVSSGCNETDLKSDDPAIQPPLSPAELAYQCGSASSCKLQWYPGLLCFTVPEVPFSSRPHVDGYKTRAKLQGYRVVAGPSGTTQNMLQLGALLGFTGEEFGLLRLTMAAWMLCTNDHSLFEILLGGEPYMPPNSDWSMRMELSDLGTLMPRDVKVGTHVFSRAEVWQLFVTDWLRGSSEGMAIFKQLPAAHQDYLISLVA